MRLSIVPGLADMDLLQTIAGRLNVLLVSYVSGGYPNLVGDVVVVVVIVVASKSCPVWVCPGLPPRLLASLL